MNSLHLELLRNATDVLREKDVKTYFSLREGLRNPAHLDRSFFSRKFASYYGLNRAHLGSPLTTKFFELLFNFPNANYAEPYGDLLKQLYDIPRQKGDRVLCFSFVTKLIAIHDESKPLYDRHVRDFFGLMPPAIGSVDFRIVGFLANLAAIQKCYADWTKGADFHGLTAPLFQRIPDLSNCHSSRVCDFLVWTVGSKNLWGQKEKNIV